MNVILFLINRFDLITNLLNVHLLNVQNKVGQLIDI